MINYNFAIFIISHARADSVETVKSLKKCNYSGRWYIICDDEDDQLDKYKDNFGEDHILVFNKDEIRPKFDMMDNFEGKGTPIFVRNAIWEIAKKLGLEYYLELDDDYCDFSIRSKVGTHLPIFNIVDFDGVCNAYIEFLNCGDIATVAFAQTGEMMGGLKGQVWRKKIKRKAMNAYFCKVDKPFDWHGRLNDDVNTYLFHGRIGKLFLTTAIVNVCQKVTQSKSGGITETYLNLGTYIKSFSSVMLRPDCVKVSSMGITDRRMHHEINDKCAYPMIISSKFKVE